MDKKETAYSLKSKAVDSSHWWPDLDAAIGNGVLAAFPTKQKAAAEAVKWGWGGMVIRIRRRFESIWIIGHIDIHPTYIAGIPNEELKVPLLRYENAQQPVAKFHRPITKRSSLK